VQVGDWGREGNLNQSEVARAMAASGSEPDFVISTGDNFYVRPIFRIFPWPPCQCVLANPVGYASGLCLCKQLCLYNRLSVRCARPGLALGPDSWRHCCPSVRLVTITLLHLAGERLDVCGGLPAGRVLQQRL